MLPTCAYVRCIHRHINPCAPLLWSGTQSTVTGVRDVSDTEPRKENSGRARRCGMLDDDMASASGMGKCLLTVSVGKSSLASGLLQLLKVGVYLHHF